MGQMGDGDQLERAFAGATVHDMFNFMVVAILLPVEVITGYLDRLTYAMVKNANPSDGESWEGTSNEYVLFRPPCPLYWFDRVLNFPFLCLLYHQVPSRDWLIHSPTESSKPTLPFRRRLPRAKPIATAVVASILSFANQVVNRRKKPAPRSVSSVATRIWVARPFSRTEQKPRMTKFRAVFASSLRSSSCSSVLVPSSLFCKRC